MAENNHTHDIFTDYPDVVTPEDLQEMLHIGRSMAYSLLQDQKIKSLRIGKKYIIPKDSVINFLRTA